MRQKSIAIVATLSATMLTAVFTTTLPFGLKSAEGQLPPPTIRCLSDTSGILAVFVSLTLDRHQTQPKAEQTKILFVVDSHIHVDDAFE